MGRYATVRRLQVVVSSSLHSLPRWTSRKLEHAEVSMALYCVYTFSDLELTIVRPELSFTLLLFPCAQLLIFVQNTFRLGRWLLLPCVKSWRVPSQGGKLYPCLVQSIAHLSPQRGAYGFAGPWVTVRWYSGNRYEPPDEYPGVESDISGHRIARAYDEQYGENVLDGIPFTQVRLLALSFVSSSILLTPTS